MDYQLFLFFFTAVILFIFFVKIILFSLEKRLIQ